MFVPQVESGHADTRSESLRESGFDPCLSSVDNGAAAASWCGGDASGVSAFARGIRCAEFEFAQQRAQCDVHFHVGEGGADAAPDASAERNPGVGVRVAAEEAVRIERLGVREVLLGLVRQRDAHDHGVMLGNDPLAQPDSFTRHPGSRLDDRTGALHLPDRRLPQFGSPGIGFRCQPGQQPRMPA